MPVRPTDLFVDTSGWAEVIDRTLPFHAVALDLSNRAVAAGS